MSTQDMLTFLSIFSVSFGVLWSFLTIRKYGLLELIERAGFVLAAWARSQKYAAKWRKFEYRAMRGVSSQIDDEDAMRAWHQVVVR